jgi:hypothetical protein
MVGQLKAKAEKARSEVLKVEAAVRDELHKQELQRNYRTARFELEQLNQLFTPLKKTVEDLQNELRPRQNAPAQLVEQAVPPRAPNVRDAGRGPTILAASGAVLALGVGLLLMGRKPAKQPA